MSEQHSSFAEDFDYLSTHLQVQEKRGDAWYAHYWLDLPTKKVEAELVKAKARKHARLAKKVTKRQQRIVRVVTHHVRKTMCYSTQEVL